MPKATRRPKSERGRSRNRGSRDRYPGGSETCSLPHVQPEPRIEDYVEVWPPEHVVSSTTCRKIVRALGYEGLVRANHLESYADANYWAVDPDVLEFLVENSRARQMPSSPSVRIYHPEQLSASTDILSTYEDGSVLIRGSTGDCDGPSEVFHGEAKLFSSTSGIGLELAIGWATKNRRDETTNILYCHELNWCIDPDGTFWFFEVKWPLDIFVFEPTPELGVITHIHK